MEDDTLEPPGGLGSLEERSELADSPELAYALIATYYKENYRRLVKLVSGRFHSLDGEDIVQDLFSKVLDGVDSSSATELPDHVYRWTQDHFVTRSLINASLDRLRASRNRRELVLDLGNADTGPLSWTELEQPDGRVDPDVAPFHPEDVIAQLDALRRRTAVRAMLQVLHERGTRPSRRLPYLTWRQHGTLVALYDAGLDADDDEPSTDHALHAQALHQNARTRDRFRNPNGATSPDLGGQSRAAARLGVSRQAISKALQSVKASMTLVHYLAGVLAPDKTLLDAGAIHRHVDAYDHLDEQPDRSPHRHRLASAAAAVRTTRATGTRVQPDLLENASAASLQDLIGTLHEAEQSLTELTQTAEPNCVAVCAVHTRRPDRVTEVYL